MNNKSLKVKIFLYSALVLLSISLLLPLISLILTSFKSFDESVGVYRWFPKAFNLDNYRKVFALPDFNYWVYPVSYTHLRAHETDS